MVGVLPKTKLLLVNEIVVVGEFSSYSEIGHYFNIKVTDEGVVIFNGKEQLPHYVVTDDGPIVNNYWKSKSDIIRDWCSRHMRLPSGYRVYRFLA